VNSNDRIKAAASVDCERIYVLIRNDQKLLTSIRAVYRHSSIRRADNAPFRELKLAQSILNPVSHLVKPLRLIGLPFIEPGEQKHLGIRLVGAEVCVRTHRGRES
jgi:hypothetical protein